jgi:DNA polymerase III gamma/tau subunit
MADVRKTDTGEEQLSAYADVASHFSEGDLLRVAEILRKVESDIRWSAFPRFAVETALVKIVYLDSTVTVQQILASFKNDNSASSVPEKTVEYSPGDKKKSDGQQLTEEFPPSYAAAPVASIPLKEDACSFDSSSAQAGVADITQLWPAFVEKIIEEKQNLGTFVSMGYIASHTDHSIDLRFGKQFGFQFAEVTRKNNRAFLEKKLETVMGRPVELHITREKEDGHGQKPEIKAAHNTGIHHSSLEDDVANEPVIKSVLELFDGQVI